MMNLKKILAMVLVVAMTFTMLPVFAAAEDVAAVETVAPAAEPASAPAAEAPAAEAAPAPAAEPAAAPAPVAVEDVAPIAAEEPAAAPVAEAIQTVAAELDAPKAELQATYDTDADAIADGYFMKAIAPDSTVTYYNTLKSAFTAANAWTAAGGKLELLADWDLVNPEQVTAGTKTYNDTSVPGVTVQGYWFDLCDHTLILSYGGNGSDQFVGICYRERIDGLL